MNKEFIPYEQALELKELGFDEPCFGYYLCKNSAFGVELELTTNWIDLLPYDSSSCKAILYQQAFRWFREKHSNIEFSLPLKKQKDLGIFWGGFIQTENDNFGKSYGSNFKTYEEAELACLIKLIEICKKQII